MTHHLNTKPDNHRFRFRYETLRSLLNKNGGALQILSDLEADLNHMHHYDKRIRRPIGRLITESLLMAQELNLMTDDRHTDLYDVLFRLRGDTDRVLAESRPAGDRPLVVGLADPAAADPALVGGKAAGLAQLARYFPEQVPAGFVATTAAYDRLIEENHLDDRIRLLLTDLDVTEDADRFQSRTRTIRQMVREAAVNGEVEKMIQAQAEQTGPDLLWAVRSSAVSEDGPLSFAGQFDSEFQVNSRDLITAYRHVLAGRFSDRAVRYRIHHNIREVDTPMAVLFMPMIEPAAAGVIYTEDAGNAASDTLTLSAVPGLADRMVRGEVPADTFRVSLSSPRRIVEVVPAAGEKGDTGYLDESRVLGIADLACRAAEKFGHALDMEWAVDKNGAVWFLQARRLSVAGPDQTPAKATARKDESPLLEGGITIFPGRAEGPVTVLNADAPLSGVPEGAVVLVEQPRPELASILPKVAALLVMEGNPVGHLATLVREFGVPCLFRVGRHASALSVRNVVSVNATRRRVYDGSRWPGIRERVMARIGAGNRRSPKSGLLYDLVLGLNLLDPDASSFKARSCRSVHDTLRFMHEMSVRAMFGFGDRQNRGLHRTSRKLDTDLPVKFQLIDLDRSIPPELRRVTANNVASVPFQALWRGVSDSRLVWAERWGRAMQGMPSDFKEAVLGGNKGPRRPSDKNYAIVAGDYMNLNARFAYHYAMIDAMVGPGADHNHVHFRFRGGGGREENRQRRARFLERVLRESGFGVDRSGDLVTAWLRRYPQADSEKALECLGRLIVCARQLDAVLQTDDAVKRYVAYFLDEQFGMFG